MLLRKAYEQAREHVIKELKRNDYRETKDGYHLSQYSLTELKSILANL